MTFVMLRRFIAFIALFSMGSLEAQTPTRPFPSLAKRPVESRDRSVTVAPVEPAAPDPGLVEAVENLEAKATAGDVAFNQELSRSKQAVADANDAAPVSENWVVAQEAISALDAARYESVAALATLDTLHVDHMNNPDGARASADMATIDPARARVLAMVDAQNDALDALRGSLTQP